MFLDAKPLNDRNKGFKMLKKMGWKPGQSLGKRSSGMLEPIAVTLKLDKSGLGNHDDSYSPRKRSHHDSYPKRDYSTTRTRWTGTVKSIGWDSPPEYIHSSSSEDEKMRKKESKRLDAVSTEASSIR